MVQTPTLKSSVIPNINLVLVLNLIRYIILLYRSYTQFWILFSYYHSSLCTLLYAFSKSTNTMRNFFFLSMHIFLRLYKIVVISYFKCHIKFLSVIIIENYRLNDFKPKNSTQNISKLTVFITFLF